MEPGAIGAAAVRKQNRNGNVSYRSRKLDTYNYKATNQRAEIFAIIVALKWAMDVYKKLNNSPRIHVTIHSDSRYAVKCMNEWLAKWLHNGWTTSANGPVANRDILQDAIDAENRILNVGNVSYSNNLRFVTVIVTLRNIVVIRCNSATSTIIDVAIKSL